MDVKDVVVPGAGLLVAVVLLALALHPAPLSGIVSDSYVYEVEPVGSEGYEDRIAFMGGNWGTEESDIREREYDDLSPEAQAAFDRAHEAPADDRGTRTYDPAVCRPHLPACPYTDPDDLSEEPSHEFDGDPAEGAVIVATGEGRYLFSTGATRGVRGKWLLLYDWIASFLVLVPYAVFLAGYATGAVREYRLPIAAGAGVVTYLSLWWWLDGVLGLALAVVVGPPAVVALTPWTPDRRLRAIAVGIGALLAVVAVAVPYLVGAVAEWNPGFLGPFTALLLSWGGMLGLSIAALRSRPP